MTEEEAKTKWCPFVRGMVKAEDRDETATGFNTGFNVKSTDQFPLGNCIASDCMAWRWASQPTPPPSSLSGDGHCGLAGKP